MRRLLMHHAWTTLVVAFCAGPHSSECTSCRSNSTHIIWRCPSDEAALDASIRIRALDNNNEHKEVDCDCRIQLRAEAEKECLSFLKQNVMPFDVPNMETLGFVSDDDVDVDGLDSGLVGPTVKLALDAKVKHSWTDALPQQVFYEFVLNYANVNEARSNWRPLLHDVVKPMIENVTSIREAVKVINTKLWKALARRDNECIVFQSGQTPLIFDPMSVIAFGYASCTGLAILFIDALRAAGVPARLVGTPAWHGNRTQGNHNWVEVLVEEGKWYFMEPSAAQEIVDTLDRDPCERWFCNKGAGFGNGTQVYAARLDRSRAETHYPMAWEWNSTDVPGVNRTDHYAEVCTKCK